MDHPNAGEAVPSAWTALTRAGDQGMAPMIATLSQLLEDFTR